MIPFVGQLIEGPSGPKSLRLDLPLGSGAFGVVYSARDAITGERYAVKFPQAGVLGDKMELVAFSNEVRAAQEINHTNVVNVVYTQGDVDETAIPYLVMEYIDGGTLGGYLDALAGQGKSLEPEHFEVVDGPADRRNGSNP